MATDTVWELEPHTKVKHQVYDGYLDAWFPIILQHFGTATYAEGYAGPGIYTQGEPGSPIRALARLRNAQQRMSTAAAAAPVRFVLIDHRHDRISKLITEFEKVLHQPLRDGRYDDGRLSVLIRRGDCEQDLPPALTEVGAWGNPILAILDSFGGGCTQNLLTRFATNPASEVLTTVDVQHFVRELDPARADRVFGSSHWRQVADQPTETKRAFICQQLDHATRGAGFHHVVRFGLHTRTGGELLLQFGTNNDTGLTKFKDSLWNADPVAGGGFRDPAIPDQQLLPMQLEPDLGTLRRILREHLWRQPAHTATLDELRTYTFTHTIFKRSHTVHALEVMRQNQQIDTHPKQTKIHPRTRGTTRITARPQQDSLFS